MTSTGKAFSLNLQAGESDSSTDSAGERQRGWKPRACNEARSLRFFFFFLLCLHLNMWNKYLPQVFSSANSLFQAQNSDITVASCLSFFRNLLKHHLVCWTFLNTQDKITPPTTFFYTWLCFIIASIIFYHILLA